MALVISAVQVTGIATAYTVPAGKIAKVRVVNVTELATTKEITIGHYVAKNSTNGNVWSRNQGNDTGSTSSMPGPRAGFVFCSSFGREMISRFMYVKEDHVLVAGQTVSCDDAGCTMSYTIFQEDV